MWTSQWRLGKSSLKTTWKGTVSKEKLAVFWWSRIQFSKYPLCLRLNNYLKNTWESQVTSVNVKYQFYARTMTNSGDRKKGKKHPRYQGTLKSNEGDNMQTIVYKQDMYRINWDLSLRKGTSIKMGLGMASCRRWNFSWDLKESGR